MDWNQVRFGKLYKCKSHYRIEYAYFHSYNDITKSIIMKVLTYDVDIVSKNYVYKFNKRCYHISKSETEFIEIDGSDIPNQYTSFFYREYFGQLKTPEQEYHEAFIRQANSSKRR